MTIFLEFLELFLTFFRIGLFTFGGGYAMLPLIQDAVIKNQWLTEEAIVNFIAVSESTPGPFAINIATYVGMERGRALLDLPGGFIDSFETGEEGIAREVFEESGLRVTEVKYLFSLPNTYLYSGFEEHTLDLFFLCRTAGYPKTAQHYYYHQYTNFFHYLFLLFVW